MKAQQNRGAIRSVTVLLHLLFWTGLFSIYYISFTDFMSSSHSLVRAASMTVLLASVFYINTQVLINVFFSKRNYFLYAVTLLLTLLVTIRIKIAIDMEWTATLLPFTVKRPYAIAFLPILFCIVLSSLLQLLINMYNKDKKHIEQINEFSQAQAQFLKNQINPHFLFNNLNNIYSMVLNKSEQAPATILKLAELLRYAIYKSNEKSVSAKEEIMQIKNLISLYEVKEDATINVRVNENMFLSDAYIEPMILIPLVENCFKHWDLPANPKAFIYIEIISDKNCFTFITENSVHAEKNKGIKKEGGVGLDNIIKRLKLRYGPDAHFFTEEHGNTFKTQLEIVWNKK